MVGDETLQDFITGTWLNDATSGGVFATPNPNVGGGASGGNGNGGNTQDRSNKSPEQLMADGRK